MCELFGISGKNPMVVNNYLRKFIAHSDEHPNGWGLAFFHDNFVNVEKEPEKASSSLYLKSRLRQEIEATNMLAHIRLATKGAISFENCHPFVKRDNQGRTWTLIHNGTIFECEKLHPYVHVQKGKTDSERILLYIVDLINQEQNRKNRSLTLEERFQILDQVILTITPGNKVNLLIYDSEALYVHTNCKDTLHQRNFDDRVIFATVPLDFSGWENVTFNTLEAYRDGKKILSGTRHDNEYIFDPEHMKLIYIDYSDL